MSVCLSLNNSKRQNQLGCNIYRYLCLGPWMDLGLKKQDPVPGSPEKTGKTVLTLSYQMCYEYQTTHIEKILTMYLDGWEGHSPFQPPIAALANFIS